jgi:hypothetical protein
MSVDDETLNRFVFNGGLEQTRFNALLHQGLLA